MASDKLASLAPLLALLGCLVSCQGCDGSAILDSATANVPTKKLGIPNDVIYRAMEALEAKCGDATFFLGNETLHILLPPIANVTVVEAIFKSKGLSLDEIDTPSVGISHLSSFHDSLPGKASDAMAMNSTIDNSVMSKRSSGGSTLDQGIKTRGNLGRHGAMLAIFVGYLSTYLIMYSACISSSFITAPYAASRERGAAYI